MLASGTTNSSGIVYLVWMGSSTVYVTVTAPRLTSYGNTLTLAAAGGRTIALSTPLAGYHCPLMGCAYPLADTLHLTDSMFGATTLTWDNTWGGWLSPIVCTTITTTPAEQTGCCGTPSPRSQQVVYGWNARTSLYGCIVAYTCAACSLPPDAVHWCSNPNTIPITTYNCFIPGVSSFSYVNTVPPNQGWFVAGCGILPWCQNDCPTGPTVTFTITE